MSEIRHIRFEYSTVENKTPGAVITRVMGAIEEVVSRGDSMGLDLDWSTFEINTRTEWIDERTFASEETESTPISVMEFSIEGVVVDS